MDFPARFRKSYQATAIVLLNTCVLFVLGNLVLFAFLEIRDRSGAGRNPVAEKHGRSWVQTRYPDMNEKDVDALLKETWSLHMTYEPYTQFRERPFSGTWVTVDPHGFRVSRNQGPWPPSREYFNVFVFGGSTTFNYGVANHQTIASHLQEFLSHAGPPKPVRVYNWGRGFYFTSQERILFQKLLVAGVVPDMAIFIDGLNEFYYTGDDPRFSRRLELMNESWEMLKKIPMVRVFLPPGRVSRGEFGRVWDLVRLIQTEERLPAANGEETFNDPAILNRIIRRYLHNKRIIGSVSAAYNVKAIFAWQPIPVYGNLAAETMSLGRHTYAKFGYPLMAIQAREQHLGENFLWCADIDQRSSTPLYVDSVHYSAEMSERVARCITDKINEMRLMGNGPFLPSPPQSKKEGLG